MRADLLGKLGHLQAEVGEYLEIYRSESALSSKTATVGQVFDEMEEMSVSSLAALDSITEAMEDLRAGVDEALERDADVRVSRATLAEYFSEYERWIVSHRRQGAPDLCRNSVPQAADNDPLEVWAVKLVTCLAAFMESSVVTDGFDAAERINSINAQLVEAWS